MGGEKIEQAQDALHFILEQLNEGDRFSVVGFDHRLSVLSTNLLPVDDGTLADAQWFVAGLEADGNTDMEAALQAGLKILLRSDAGGGTFRYASQMIVFLTDGLPTEGVVDEPLIAELVNNTNAQVGARLHVFGVGYDVNTHLLDHLASDNGGSVTYVQPGDNLEAVLTGFYERIDRPLLTDLEIGFDGLEVSDLYPQTFPDLFQGSSLLVVGRYRSAAPAVAVRVRGRAGDETREYVYQFDLDDGPRSGRHFVPRLWATRRVGDLLDRVRVEGERPPLVEEIRELGLGYGLVTPYTTFVIQAQVEGAASADNMALYAKQTELNQAWGQTTVQARVQNQLYQQAAQADLASGANVVNQGQRSLAQIDRLNVDLALLKGLSASDALWQLNLPGAITPDWIERTVGVDRSIVFGSKEYFELADEPDARPYLQSGPNVVFAYRGQVISVQEASVNSAAELVSVLQAGVAPSAANPASDWTFAWLSDVLFGLLRVVTAWIGA
jgi:Ca-activated chloride channel family protein